MEFYNNAGDVLNKGLLIIAFRLIFVLQLDILMTRY